MNKSYKLLIIQKSKLHLFMLCHFLWVLVSPWKSQKANEGKEYSEVSFFLPLVSQEDKLLGSSEASRLTLAFINVSFLCPRKEKADCLLPPALLSKNRIILRHSESPPTFYPADSRALTVTLTLLHPINRTLSKSFSVTSQKEWSV